MEIQAGFRIPHMLPDGGNLPDHIAVIPFSEMLFVQGGEGLRHVDAVQPDLVGIDVLMPPGAFRRPGLILQRPVERFRRPAVFFLPRGTRPSLMSSRVCFPASKVRTDPSSDTKESIKDSTKSKSCFSPVMSDRESRAVIMQPSI